MPDTSNRDSGFTPGPWAVVCGDNESPHYKLISANAMRDGESVNGGIYVAKVQGPDNEANARLIAASPSLYEALRQLVGNAEIAKQHMRLDDPGQIASAALFDTLDQARAALAKARGL